MRTVALVEEALTLRGFEGDNGRYQCPAHGGQDRNLWVTADEDGRVIVKCWSHPDECTTDAIFRAIDLWLERKPFSGYQEYEARKDGVVVPAVHRRFSDREPKCDWDPKGVVKVNSLDFYNSWNIDPSKPIVICEGERAAEAVAAAGLQAVATYGTSYTPSAAAVAMLGNADITLWPDADDEGRKHMEKIARAIGRPVKQVYTNGTAPRGWDAADATPFLIKHLVGDARPFNVAVAPTTLGKAKSFDQLDSTPPEPMLLGFLDPTEATVLVGDGGVGKGCTASYFIARLARLGIKTLVVDFENNEGEWGARTLSLGLDGAARTATMYVSPLSEEWEGSNEGTLWGIQEDLKRIIEEHEIDYLVIDSIIMASGDSKYESPEAARKYKAALTYLGKPSLSLAHVNRAGDHSSPFGSVFWKNLCRTMWSLEWDGNRKVLKHRKHNNYEQAAMQEVSFDWQYGKLVNATIIPAVQNTIERIQNIITFLGPCTAEEIHKQIKDNLDDGEKAPTLPAIKSTLYRGDPNSQQYNKGTPLFSSATSGKRVLWSNIGP